MKRSGLKGILLIIGDFSGVGSPVSPSSLILFCFVVMYPLISCSSSSFC